jgi:hypothetical protein
MGTEATTSKTTTTGADIAYFHSYLPHAMMIIVVFHLVYKVWWWRVHAL